VLRFYIVYRALVRAKVAYLRGSQGGSDEEHSRSRLEFRTYLELAQSETRSRRAAIAITHGVTGSGKTTETQKLVESTGAVRVRSDVERKRLHGMNAAERSGSAVEHGLYTADATEQTYARLAALARAIAAAGYVAIVDAAFLKRRQRDLLRRVAAELGVPFSILEYSAPADVLLERISRRLRNGQDASEATPEVLELQLAAEEPLTAEELKETGSSKR
jgi:predicted kinase